MSFLRPVQSQDGVTVTSTAFANQDRVDGPPLASTWSWETPPEQLPSRAPTQSDWETGQIRILNTLDEYGSSTGNVSPSGNNVFSTTPKSHSYSFRTEVISNNPIVLLL